MIYDIGVRVHGFGLPVGEARASCMNQFLHFPILLSARNVFPVTDPDTQVPNRKTLTTNSPNP